MLLNCSIASSLKVYCCYNEGSLNAKYFLVRCFSPSLVAEILWETEISVNQQSPVRVFGGTNLQKQTELCWQLDTSPNVQNSGFVRRCTLIETNLVIGVSHSIGYVEKCFLVSPWRFNETEQIIAKIYFIMLYSDANIWGKFHLTCS